MARKEVHGNILKSMVSGVNNFPEIWLPRLGGGLKQFLFSPLLGELIQIDS